MFPHWEIHTRAVSRPGCPRGLGGQHWGAGQPHPRVLSAPGLLSAGRAPGAARRGARAGRGRPRPAEARGGAPPARGGGSPGSRGACSGWAELWENAVKALLDTRTGGRQSLLPKKLKRCSSETPADAASHLSPNTRKNYNYCFLFDVILDVIASNS